MPRSKRYYFYIMASKSRVLYVGVTGFLMARVQQHKAAESDSLAKRYNINRLVYYAASLKSRNGDARRKWR